MVRTTIARMTAGVLGLFAILVAAGCGSDFGAATDDSGSPGAGTEAGVDAGHAGDATADAQDAQDADTSPRDDGPANGGEASSDGASCPPGQRWCASCAGSGGHCGQVCPAIACAADAASPMDGAPDAALDSAADAPFEASMEASADGAFEATADGAMDASTDSGNGRPCAPACASGMICCSGGTAGAHLCLAPLAGGRCPLVP